MPAYHALYRESQGRIMSLVNNGNAGLPVAACPGWTVRDTVAHLLGAFADIAAGKIAEAEGDAWSAGHLAKVGSRSVGDLGAEWHLRANTNPAAFQAYGGVLLADIITHEFDIKQALGNRQGRDLPVVRSIAIFFLSGLDSIWREDGVPPLRILTESKPLDIGGDEPTATVEMSWWEIGRVATGRRSPDQVRALAWSTDPEPWLDHLFVFGPRDTPLDE